MRISGIIALLVLVTAVSGCLSGNGPQTGKTAVSTSTVDKTSGADSLDTKINSEAGVTITAVYLGSNDFEVKLDTHSGSLDYEMAKLSYVRDSKGNIIKPESWDGGIG
ncbi:MAG: hypothetical protein QSU88_03415, partial [Candidatus Methanoperedens sp.]|nr:hypothetical protein [Candidatus Methanoperedens sp.]